MKNKEKKEMICNVNKCTGCRICQLICSFTFFKRFSPNEAFIQISDEYELIPKIKFKENCTRCGICIDYCLYGALGVKEGKS